MSKTDKDVPAKFGGKWAMFTHYGSNKHAPSVWKHFYRRHERRVAKQAMENRREPMPRYHRPYYH